MGGLQRVVGREKVAEGGFPCSTGYFSLQARVLYYWGIEQRCAPSRRSSFEHVLPPLRLLSRAYGQVWASIIHAAMLLTTIFAVCIAA